MQVEIIILFREIEMWLRGEPITNATILSVTAYFVHDSHIFLSQISLMIVSDSLTLILAFMDSKFVSLSCSFMTSLK